MLSDAGPCVVSEVSVLLVTVVISETVETFGDVVVSRTTFVPGMVTVPEVVAMSGLVVVSGDVVVSDVVVISSVSVVSCCGSG